MRRLLVAGFIALAAQGAQAADPADVPILRGSFHDAPRTYRAIWQGFYVGGQAGYGASKMEFSGFNEPGWPGLAGISHRSTSFGGFAGYNAQFENVIVGIDGSYMHGTFSGSTASTSTTTTVNVGPVFGLDDVVTMRSDGAMTIKDFGSIRVRGGYVAGNFLPYAFVGVGLGRADTFRSNTISGVYTGTTAANGVSALPRPPTTISRDTNNQLVHGVTGGFGLDWMLFGGLFVRAEYEYLQFTSTLDSNIHSVRGGVGYKF